MRHSDEPEPGSNEAAIALFGPPASAFVTNTVIVKSATNAFERGWRGAAIDFRPTNTFTEITYCKQTNPLARRTIRCPTPDTCDL